MLCLTVLPQITGAGGDWVQEGRYQEAPTALRARLNDAGVEFNEFVVIGGCYQLDVQLTELADLAPMVSALFISDGESPPRWRYAFDATNTPTLALNICSTAVTNLSPLHGLPISLLWLANTSVTDLSPLRGMPLTSLHISRTRISDLSALEGVPLDS